MKNNFNFFNNLIGLILDEGVNKNFCFYYFNLHISIYTLIKIKKKIDNFLLPLFMSTNQLFIKYNIF